MIKIKFKELPASNSRWEMRLLLTSFALAAIFCVVSAITGIAFYKAASGTDTVVEYWHGYERLYPVAIAVIFAIASWAIYRRWPPAWKIGFGVIYVSFAAFIFQAWWSLWPQPLGWVGAVAITIVAPFFALLSASRWYQQKRCFFPDVAEGAKE